MGVGEMLGGGARLVRTQPKALTLWALLYLVVAGAMTALARPMMIEAAELQRRAMTAGAAGAPSPEPASMFIPAFLLMELVLVVAMVAIFAAAVRAVARGGNDRFGFLRLGMDEARLIGLAVLLWIVVTVAAVLLMLAAALVGAVLSTLVARTPLLAFLPMVVAIPLLLWAEIRLSLVGAFTVLHGRIVVGPAWRATRGRVWTLIAAYLAIGLVYAAVALALTAILFPDLLGLYAAILRGGDPLAVLQAQQAVFAQPFGPRMLIGIVLGAVVNTTLIGWPFGTIATAAIELDNPQLERRA